MAPSATIVLLAAFVILCVFPLPSSGQFNMKISLFCPEGYKNWCANLFVYEEDPYSTHDFVAEKFVCAPANDPYANITVDFGMLDLGGDTTPSYEIMPLISHNCSSNGLQYCAAPSAAIDVPTWRRNDVKLALTLKTENDKEGACVHPEVAH